MRETKRRGRGHRGNAEQLLLPMPQIVEQRPVIPRGQPQAPPEHRGIPETCPRCGEALKLRSGPYSKFLGCTGYPRCRHIVPLTKEQVAKWEMTHTIRAVKNAGKKAATKAKRQKRTAAEARTEAVMDAEFMAIIG